MDRYIQNRIEELVRQFEVDLMEIVGDEFAPKQQGGSPERERLIGLLAKTTPLASKLEARLKKLVRIARQNQVQQDFLTYNVELDQVDENELIDDDYLDIRDYLMKDLEDKEKA